MSLDKDSIVFELKKQYFFLFFVYLLVTVLSSSGFSANRLRPFSSDGCSMSPDGTFTELNLLLDCCIYHDLSYWRGGDKEERLQADEELRLCVLRKSNSFIAQIYYYGVRVGGTNLLRTPFRWGYGWETERGYHALNAEEQKQVAEKTKEIDWDTIYNSILKP